MNTPALLGTNQTNEQEYFCMESLNFDFQLDEFIIALSRQKIKRAKAPKRFAPRNFQAGYCFCDAEVV